MASRFRTTDRTGMTGLLVGRLRAEGRGADTAFTVAELRRALLPYPRCREALGLASKAEYDVALLRLLDGNGLVLSDDPELDEEVERELDSPEPALGFLDDHAAVVLRPGPRLERELSSAATEGDREEREEEESPEGPEEREGGASAEGSRDDETDRASGSADGGRVGGGGAVADPAEGAGSPEATDPAEAAEPAERTELAGADEHRAGDAPDAPSTREAAGPTTGAVPPERTSAGAGDGAASDGCPACGGDLPDADGVRYCPHCGEDVASPRCRECGGELAAGWRYCPYCGSDRHA